VDSDQHVADVPSLPEGVRPGMINIVDLIWLDIILRRKNCTPSNCGGAALPSMLSGSQTVNLQIVY
jgi:hypothetical protein